MGENLTTTINRHATVVKSKSKNRPHCWTQAQVKAHDGIKPNFEQQMTISWENVPEEKYEASLGYKLNNFLINLNVSLLTRRNYVVEVKGIVGNFSRHFKNFKGDGQKLFEFFEGYTKSLFELEKLYPMPENFQTVAYEPRKNAFLNLRKDGVKTLKELMGVN